MRFTLSPVMVLTRHQREQLRNEPTETGNRVAKAIELTGLSKAEVSRGTGLPYTYVTDVAYGRFQTITVEKAHIFAAFFGCDIADLFPARQAVA